MKRYVLTLTAYKFLDIGIVVGSTSHRNCDQRQSKYNPASCMEGVHREADIERLMQSTVPSSSSSIQDLNVELVKVCDTKNVKLSLYDTCLYMKSITVLFLFKLEQCTEHVYYKLSQYTHGVSEKFKYFVSFLKQNCITNKRDAANTLHKIYDKNSIIECELCGL
ncbi:hypothetical protein ALC56_02496 [Trachymyrmex septentrionalis]|uniref:Uncharacterized protein n=1 Tax=Trachymyrmex septentrionalis TaxID=34720 RepID=A0A151K067_9HYME|nr:hypothetical protein ALC56_02496 [Trachymyrmex septentrionalis]